MSKKREYDEEYNAQAVKLAKNLGSAKAAAEKADQGVGKRKSPKEQRLKYIAYRTDDGKNAGKIRFYCKALEVSRQAFYDYLKRKKKPWKYQPLADAMLKIHAADEENTNYGIYCIL